MLLGTLEDYAAMRGVAFDLTDTAAQIALETASAIVTTYLERDFTLTTDDEITLQGTGTAALLLPAYPVSEVAEVVHIQGETETTLVEGTDYLVELSAGILRSLGWHGWSRWDTYRITYTHGYDAVPSDVTGVVYAIAQRRQSQGTSGGQTVRQEQIGTYLVQYDTALSGDDETDLETLARYRSPRVA